MMCMAPGMAVSFLSVRRHPVEEVVWISLDTSHGASPILSFSRIVSVSICMCKCIYGKIVFII